jgi:hypothetical protein
MPEKTQPCPKKDKIDKHAQDALDEIGRLVRSNKELDLQLDPVKTHLRDIMADHHHL